MSDTNSRRQFLLSASVAASGLLAGCTSDLGGGTGSSRETNNSTRTPSSTSTRTPSSTPADQRSQERIRELEQELEEKEQRIEELESQSNRDSDFSDEVRSQALSIGETVRQAVVVLKAGTGGGGTAWFIDDDTLVTNSHVVGDSDSFECWTINGEKFSPSLTGKSDHNNSPYHDVAVLDTDFSPQTTLSLGNSDTLTKGQPVVQVGHPFSVGEWVVALGRYLEESYGGGILSSVPNVSGNSGSPLVDLDGNVVGLTTGNTLQEGGSRGDPEPVPLEVKEEYDSNEVATHESTPIIEQYVTQFS
ncbi:MULTISPECIES: S1C family serine protease [Haloarcula]|uniref:S1C family serine protease n=1 Tax=Haloarcula TaxID=2237 RepID=UPI0023EB980F|nr:trypsin-like peptidase domain-containing protein [Halomicroarcula sp. XH51]